MNVSLRNFKHFPSLSEETYAFQSDIVIDGKLAGTASNRGQGGPTQLSISDKDRKQLAEYAKSLPGIETEIVNRDGSTFIHQLKSAEDVIDNLVHEQVMRKEQARLEQRFMEDVTTKLMVLLPDGTIMASKKMSPAQLTYMFGTQNLPSWAEKGQVINVLPFEEAKKIWFKAVVR